MAEFTPEFDETYYDYILKNPVRAEEITSFLPSAFLRPFGQRYAFLHVPVNDLKGNLIENVNRLGYGAVPKLFGPMDSSGAQSIGAIKVQNQPVLSLRGQGCLIGIVDSGINYELPIFQNEDGSSRILSMWNQENNQIYSTEEITAALQSENPQEQVVMSDESGHGTFLAGIAAAKPDEAADFVGVAPDSRLVIVKCRPAKQYLRDFFLIPKDAVAYSEVDLLLGMNYLIQVAIENQMPLVILVGLGTNQGGHDGTLPLADYLASFADARGIAVVQAAGNEGNELRHYYGRTRSGVTDTVEIRVGESVSGFTMELWGSSLNKYRIGLQSPTGRRIQSVTLEGSAVLSYNFPLDNSLVSVHGQITPLQGGDVCIVLHFERPSEGIWQFLVESEGDFNTDYHIWLPIEAFADESVYFLNSNPYTTIVSNACAAPSMAVGMYNHKLDAIVSAASKGYTRTDAIKPDFLAPGVDIFGPNVDGTYSVKTGSSIAAAYGAGAAALMMEYGIIRGNAPDLDGGNIRALFIRDADRKSSIEYPNRDWGYGTLNLVNVIQNL